MTALIIGDHSSEDVIYSIRLCKDLNLKYHHITTDISKSLLNLESTIYDIETFEPNVVRGSLLSIKLAELASNLGFKIVLCGEGSDEIFAGYGDFLFINNDDDFQSEIKRFLEDLYRTQLLRIDKTGMRYAVEVREPFLDRDLVEYVLKIPPRYKVALNNRGLKTTKYILREAFKNILPEYIYYREKMTLMAGAGIGGVEKKEGKLYQFSATQIKDNEYKTIANNFEDYRIKDLEEAYCFKYFSKNYLKAEFAKNRVKNASYEISEHR